MRPLNVERAGQAGAQVYHEVWKNGSYTGRQFTSLVAAARYAEMVGGEVKKATNPR